MAKSRGELDGMLDELERDLLMLMMDGTEHADVWEVFAGQADAIESSAGSDDLAYVRARTNKILGAQGILPPGSYDEISD